MVRTSASATGRAVWIARRCGLLASRVRGNRASASGRRLACAMPSADNSGSEPCPGSLRSGSACLTTSSCMCATILPVRAFACPVCNAFVGFEAEQCANCQAPLGFHLPSKSMLPVVDGSAIVDGTRWVACTQHATLGCNWLAPDGQTSYERGRCLAHSLIRREPAADDTLAR